MANPPPANPRSLSRCQMLALGLGGLALAGAGGYTGIELVRRGILPGRRILDELDGACDVPGTTMHFSKPGHSVSGTFFSRYRNRTVGYSIGYPHGHRRGSPLPLVVCLHPNGGTHRRIFGSMSFAQVPSLLVNGRPLRPMAFVSVDGGRGYWNPHPGDDPMGMLVNEVIPMCRRLGLGEPYDRIGTFGISMGGFGALLLAEQFPHLISAVAAVSPAIWTSYSEASSANPVAYASAQAFARYDAVTHTDALRAIPVRVACGRDDPFEPGVEALAQVLPAGAVVKIGKGCHTGPFFASQEPPSLAFLSDHL